VVVGVGTKEFRRGDRGQKLKGRAAIWEWLLFDSCAISRCAHSFRSCLILKCDSGVQQDTLFGKGPIRDRRSNHLVLATSIIARSKFDLAMKDVATVQRENILRIRHRGAPELRSVCYGILIIQERSKEGWLGRPD
jgi:hypothetical protein